MSLSESDRHHHLTLVTQAIIDAKKQMKYLMVTLYAAFMGSIFNAIIAFNAKSLMTSAVAAVVLGAICITTARRMYIRSHAILILEVTKEDLQ